MSTVGQISSRRSNQSRWVIVARCLARDSPKDGRKVADDFFTRLYIEFSRNSQSSENDAWGRNVDMSASRQPNVTLDGHIYAIGRFLQRAGITCELSQHRWPQESSFATKYPLIGGASRPSCGSRVMRLLQQTGHRPFETGTRT